MSKKNSKSKGKSPKTTQEAALNAAGEEALLSLGQELEKAVQGFDLICPLNRDHSQEETPPPMAEPLPVVHSEEPGQGVGFDEKQLLSNAWRASEARLETMRKKELVRIGTRGSALALWQARHVQALLHHHHPDLQVELVIIKTTGDKILDVPLAKVGGKGLFVKELEEAMLEGRIDLAVHSMKDVPTQFPDGLVLGPILEREDPRDAVLSVDYASLAALPHGARVGSSSLRRLSQIRHIRPDLEIVSLRGNVNTRILKLETGEFEAILLAAAGVKRLEMLERVVEFLDPEQVIPAIGQGAIGIELRRDDARMETLLAPLNHPATQTCVTAERAFLATLEGGCQVPIAAHATLSGERLSLHGRVADLDGERMITLRLEGAVEEAAQIGEQLAREMLRQGADIILEEIYGQGDAQP